MIIIAGSMSFDAADRVDVLSSLAEVTEASRATPAAWSTGGPKISKQPNTFCFFECWESKDLLDAHLAQPHETAFGERNLGRLSGATATMFEASPLPPG